MPKKPVIWRIGNLKEAQQRGFHHPSTGQKVNLMFALPGKNC